MPQARHQLADLLQVEEQVQRGLDRSQLKRLKELEAEVAQYKRMYAELAHENYALKELIEKRL